MDSTSSNTTTINVVRYLMNLSSSCSSSNINSNNHKLMKFLTRKLIHELISIGAIKIDNRILTTQDAAEDATRYNVTIDATTGTAISSVEICPHALESLKKNIRAWAYIKPEGVDCNLNERDRSSLIHILKRAQMDPKSVFPVGRLDKDSCGLLILTNSGGLCERLHHPRFVHEKEYVVEIARTISTKAEERDEFYKRMSGGSVTWRNSKTNEVETGKPCSVAPFPSSSTTRERFRIILTEGKNRQIRNMVESVGASMIKDGISEKDASMKQDGFYVTFLKRIRVGPVSILSGEEKEILHSPVLQSRDTPPEIRELVGDELNSLIEFAFDEKNASNKDEDADTLPKRRSEREE